MKTFCFKLYKSEHKLLVGIRSKQVKDLKIRQWKCAKCGAEHDLDRNAAINILSEGLGQQPMQETESDFAIIRSIS